MANPQIQSGLAAINGAKIYYELAGEGQPFVMIHAGVADSRQWNHEFAHFAQNYRILRYDQSGFGKSEPVEREFSHMADLVALLDYLQIDEPVVVMGCSMGGTLAMDFTLTYPTRVKALIMVDSAPGGLELDVPIPEIFNEIEAASNAGDFDRVAALETQAWFDGFGRTAEQVNPTMRQLVYDMNRLALDHQMKNLGKRLPNTTTPAAGRLAELTSPVLVIVGEHDEPYSLAAADYMVQNIPSAQKLLMKDAAHLPNLDHPLQFQQVVTGFLDNLDRSPEGQ
jgi:pimeloyl-ACP methyl ester carboxylesterase